MSREAPQITVTSDPVRLTVTVEGIPHLLLRKKNITGVHGWIDLRGGNDGEIYSIGFNMARGPEIICEYDSRTKWQSILLGIQEQNLFGDFE